MQYIPPDFVCYTTPIDLEKDLLCETALISQYQTPFLVRLGPNQEVLTTNKQSKLCLSSVAGPESKQTNSNMILFFVFSSGHQTDQMSEGSQDSKVTIFVKILKWQ